MRYVRRQTLAEIVAVLGIVAVLCAIVFIPDSATSTRWHLERRAREYRAKSVDAPADPSLLATDIDLAGEWINDGLRTYSSFVFTKRGPGQYGVQFTTHGCLGGCKLSRMASLSDGIISLDGAVAEYVPRTYNTLYAIRVDNLIYLVPADGIREFERSRASGSDKWRRYAFSRHATKEPTPVARTTEGPDSDGESPPPADG